MITKILSFWIVLVVTAAWPLRVLDVNIRRKKLLQIAHVAQTRLGNIRPGHTLFLSGRGSLHQIFTTEPSIARFLVKETTDRAGRREMWPSMSLANPLDHMRLEITVRSIVNHRDNGDLISRLLFALACVLMRHDRPGLQVLPALSIVVWPDDARADINHYSIMISSDPAALVQAVENYLQRAMQNMA